MGLEAVGVAVESRRVRAERVAKRYSQGALLALIREDTREMKALLIALLVSGPVATRYLGSPPWVFVGELLLLTGLVYSVIRFVQLWPDRTLLRGERDVLRLILLPVFLLLGVVLSLDLGLPPDWGLPILTLGRAVLGISVAAYAHRLGTDVAGRTVVEA